MDDKARIDDLVDEIMALERDLGQMEGFVKSIRKAIETKKGELDRLLTDTTQGGFDA